MATHHLGIVPNVEAKRTVRDSRRDRRERLRPLRRHPELMKPPNARRGNLFGCRKKPSEARGCLPVRRSDGRDDARRHIARGSISFRPPTEQSAQRSLEGAGGGG